MANACHRYNTGTASQLQRGIAARCDIDGLEGVDVSACARGIDFNVGVVDGRHSQGLESGDIFCVGINVQPDVGVDFGGRKSEVLERSASQAVDVDLVARDDGKVGHVAGVELEIGDFIFNVNEQGLGSVGEGQPVVEAVDVDEVERGDLDR